MEHLSIRETAALYSVTPITIRRYIDAGRLPAVRIGRNIRVRRVDAEALAEPARRNESGSSSPVARGKPLSPGNGLRGLMELADDVPPGDRPTDVSSNKHKYLAEAYADLHT